MNNRFLISLSAAVFALAAYAATPAAAQLPTNSALGAISFDDAITSFNYGDNDLAYRQFQKLANEGDSRAQYYLAYMMDAGLGTGKDPSGAANWYKKSAQQDYLPAVVYLGYMYSSGHGVQRDDKEAFKWYTRAAQMGDPIAQNNLATMLQRGVPYAKNEPLAAQWFLQSAMQGNMRAQYNLAAMYRTGDGIKKNLKEAMRWYSFAANQGDMYAQNALGYMYRKGEGTEDGKPDPQTAIDWYRRAAEQGHVKSQMAIAVMYELGEAGNDRGIDDALVWYFNAAGQGNERAMHRLGYLYERGRECIDYKCDDEKKRGQGLAKDDREALKWYRKAAEERSYPPSIIALGNFYEFGRGGLKKDPRKAMEYYIKGTCYVEPLAMLELARLYREGTADYNKKPDLMRAYQWYTLARSTIMNRSDSAISADSDSDEAMLTEATRWLTDLNFKITPNDKESAKRLATGWHPCVTAGPRKLEGAKPQLSYDPVPDDADDK